MEIKFSKRAKIIAYSAIAAAAFAVGIFLECCHKKDFTITTEQPPAELPENTFSSNYDVDGRLDINTATKEELMELKGIGGKMAERIIEYREQNGQFMAIEELTLVPGIGESRIEELRDKICVR